MAGDQQNEEKSLPASAKKLRDARRKGQVPQSRDFISGVTLTMMFLYLWLAGPGIADRIGGLLDVVPALQNRPFDEAASQAIKLCLQTVVAISLPIVALVVVTDFVAGVAGTLGPVFSFELIAPKLEKISPMKGLKRIFSLRNLVEFAKSTIKVAVLATAFFVIQRAAIAPLFEIPVCGAPCIPTAALQTALPLAATAALAFLVIGIFDLLVQRQLFMRDMRMTRTELKRETKDLEGDPLIRGERRRIRVFQSTIPRLGVDRALVAITDGDIVVGLRYRAGETPAPVVVCRGRGASGQAMRATLRERAVPVAEDADLAAALHARHVPGDTVANEFFAATARVLVAAGLV